MIIIKSASGQRERETAEGLWAPYLLHKQNTAFSNKRVICCSNITDGTHNKDQKGCQAAPDISPKPHWLSMGLPEISRAARQPWKTSRHLHWLHILTNMVTIYKNSITTYHTRFYISNPSEKCIHFHWYLYHSSSHHSRLLHFYMGG